jgi:hypothetical protein
MSSWWNEPGRSAALPAAAVLLLLAAGCYSFSAREGEHRFKLLAPDSVKRGERLTFQVEVTTAGGERAEDVTYGWLLDWPDVKGVMQMGKPFVPTGGEAKCSSGTAVLRIFAKNASKRAVQVLRKDIQIE